MAVWPDRGARLKRLDAIVAGEIYADLIMSGFDVWPQPGRESFARHFHREIGGGASITACALAKLGSSAAILGVVGTEPDRWIAQSLTARGVDPSSLEADAEEPTGFTVVASTPGDRAFLTYLGANRRFPDVLLRSARSNRLSHARHVHLAFSPALDDAAALFDSVRRNECTISLDVGWHEDWLRDPRALALVAGIDIFFPNESEAAAMTGESDPEKILQAFQQAGASAVALKLGELGSALLWNGQISRIAAHPVTPVDPTGAGDCFDAGFLHAWLKGESPAVCLRTANICGALSTEVHGGIAGVPSPQRLQEEVVGICEK
jgi:ribokinase